MIVLKSQAVWNSGKPWLLRCSIVILWGWFALWFWLLLFFPVGCLLLTLLVLIFVTTAYL